jgi:cbb3-type cytochrome oxidase subunit 3
MMIISKKMRDSDIKINSLENRVRLLEKNTENMRKSIDDRFKISESSFKNQIGDVKIVLSNRTFYILLLIVLIIVLIAVVAYFLRHKMTLERKSLDNELSRTKLEIDEENLKIDSKLIEIIDKQLYVLQNKPIGSSTDDGDIDHSLVLKVADEIIRIQTNLANMDESIKGHKQLSRAVVAIIDNLNANGYEITELLSKPYDEGMRIVATMVMDENLSPGTQIIKRVVKPQVNYKGKMIQAAQVVVAYNDK